MVLWALWTDVDDLIGIYGSVIVSSIGFNKGNECLLMPPARWLKFAPLKYYTKCIHSLY